LCKQNSCRPNIRPSKVPCPLPRRLLAGTTCSQGAAPLPAAPAPRGVSARCPPAGVSPVWEAPATAAHWKRLQPQGPWWVLSRHDFSQSPSRLGWDRPFQCRSRSTSPAWWGLRSDLGWDLLPDGAQPSAEGAQALTQHSGSSLGACTPPWEFAPPSR